MKKNVFNKSVSAICAFVICFSAIGYINKNTTTSVYAADFFNLTSGYLEVEAESLEILNTTYLEVIDDAGASGGKSLISKYEANKDTASGPHISMNITSDVSEHIYIWGRFYTPNESADSIYYSYNSENAAVPFLKVSTEYFWKKIDVRQVTDNEEFTINFWTRERNVRLDKIVISNDPSLEPVGKTDHIKKDFTLNDDGVKIYNSPGIVPPSIIHPKLLFTKADIPSIRQKLDDPYTKLTWDIILKNAKTNVNAHLDTNLANNYDEIILNHITCRAFAFAIGELDETYALSAISDIRLYLETFRFVQNEANVTRKVGAVLMTLAAVYDWCYDFLTEDDIAYFIRAAKSYSMRKEAGYPPVNQNSLAHHVGEGEVFGHLLSLGISMWDEEPEIYNLAAGRIFDTMADARIDWFSAGTHPAGNTYGATRLEWELTANQLFMGMGVSEGIFGSKDNIAKTVKKYLYERLPMGKYMKSGDDWMWCGPSNNQNFWWTYLRSTNYLASYQTDDPYITQAMYMDRYLTRDVSNQSLIMNIIPIVLLIKPDNVAKIADDLPLANKTNYPFTSIQARTNWIMGINSNVAIARLDASEKRIQSHDHANQGSFQLYYKGGLATEGGLYAHRDGDYGSSHYWNYYVRTVASNCLTVFDPQEEFFAMQGNDKILYSNDGGQKLPELPDNYQEYITKDPTAATEAYFVGPSGSTPEFSFVRTNLTKSYGGHYEGENFVNKVANHTRSMVFMDLNNEDYPAALIVFDDIESTDATYKKTWNMNMIYEPVVNKENNSFTVSRTDNGNNGKLVNNVLLPIDADITAVGGQGKESWVNGQNYPASEYSPDIMAEQGQWRAEVSPAAHRKQDFFLNAMYVTDYDKNLPVLNTYSEESDNLYGVTIRDRAVYFPKSGRLSNTLSLEIRDNNFESVKCLITNVESGLWQVINTDTGKKSVYEVKSGENTLYFITSPGSINLIPLDSGSADSIFYEPMSKPGNGKFYVWNSTKNDLLTLSSPVYFTANSHMIPAKDAFLSFGAAVTHSGTELSADISDSIYTISSKHKHILLNGKVKLVNDGAVYNDGSLYINSGDYFNEEFISDAAILKLNSVDDSPDYVISFTSGSTFIYDASDIDKNIVVSGNIPNTLNADNDINAYLAISDNDTLYSVVCSKVKFISDTDHSHFELTLAQLPDDIKSGIYNINLYFWNNDISPYHGYQKINLLRGERK